MQNHPQRRMCVSQYKASPHWLQEWLMMSSLLRRIIKMMSSLLRRIIKMMSSLLRRIIKMISPCALVLFLGSYFSPSIFVEYKLN